MSIILDDCWFGPRPPAEPPMEQVFMQHALDCAALSHDPRTRVGAVLVRPETPCGVEGPYILTEGCNRLPAGKSSYVFRAAEKDQHLLHAEHSVIALAARAGLATRGTDLYVTLPPCCACMNLVIEAGVKRVYIPAGSDQTLSPRWWFDCDTARQIAKDYGVEYLTVDMSQESAC